MQSVDLNLLVVLDALLQEGSVSGAARRLHLTPPAVSRSLTRLRKATGDPLFVRAGRSLVPTPAADSMRERARDLVASVTELLAPTPPVDLERLEAGMTRTFVVRTGPDNAAAFGPALLREIGRRAPGVSLHFVNDDDRAVEDLRDARLDLVLGGPIASGHEVIHREALLEDEVVIVARRDGALARACPGGTAPDLREVASHPHVNRFPVSIWHPVIEDALADRGLRRTVVATAPGFAAAFALVRSGDLLCFAPNEFTRDVRGDDLRAWPCPVELPRLVIEQAWHHRNHHDPEHRWLRDRVRAAIQR